MKRQQDFILLILNCERYRHKALRQKETWLKDLPPTLVYYHVIGRPTQAEPYVFDEEQRVLYVQTPDTYLALPRKVIMALRAVDETFEYKYIFKTDDDQHCKHVNFFSYLPQILQNKGAHYGGHALRINDHVSQYYLVHSELPRNLKLKATTYCSGRFYFLSAAAVQYLVTEQTYNISRESLEDYAIGYHLTGFIHKEPVMAIDTPKVFEG